MPKIHFYRERKPLTAAGETAEAQTRSFHSYNQVTCRMQRQVSQQSIDLTFQLTMRTQSRSLEKKVASELVRRGDNCFDLLRTAAALLVFFSHSFALSGLPEPTVARGVTMGTCAVWVFFAISGYLIAKSLVASKNWTSFALKRGLRILPALTCVLVLSIFIAGPILTQFSLREYFYSA